VVTPLKTLMGFSVYLNVQLKFYNLPFKNKKTLSGPAPRKGSFLILILVVSINNLLAIVVATIWTYHV